jgi:hypothetical protein
VLLVHRLTRHPQRLGDLGERPTVTCGTLNRRILEAIREAPQRADGRKPIRCVRGISGRRGDHVSTIVDKLDVVNSS